MIEDIIPRKSLVEEIRQLTTPTATSRLYPLIIGEHGTGKTSLVKLAVDGIEKPKGVVYVDIPNDEDPGKITEALQKAFSWDPHLVFNSSKRNYGSSFQ